LSRLPVIVGFGGINPAGRSSCMHGFRRLVIDRLETAKAESTYRSLAALMNMDTAKLDQTARNYILDHTLIRKLENNIFDPENVIWQKPGHMLSGNSEPLSFVIKRNQLPDELPPSWKVQATESDMVRVSVSDKLSILFPESRPVKVHAAGQLPTGFDPEKLYQARSHPRGLQLTVYAASDAINSLGIDWEVIREKVPGDQISLYAASALGQLDYTGAGGLFQAPLTGKRVSSKNCALMLADMTADFVNAYVLGSVGTTGANVGACATFLYNLRQGVQDIRSGKFRVSIIGSSEAPLIPEVMEGFRTMGALADDEGLRKLDNLNKDEPDYRRACRPFSGNCGFTMSEASQFVVLFDDQLALELGMNIYGSVADVFINADGFKKSIPGPGIGNYATMGKAAGLARSILGEKTFREGTYVQAHGTGTPQNRVTESHIINEIARNFGIAKWPVAAIKSYLGHTIATASGDQVIASLGSWHDGLIPGIKTIDHIAEDVYQSNLDILMDHRQIAPGEMGAALINSKGFGGNNATGVILSPEVTLSMLEKKHGKKAITQHARSNESVKASIENFDAACIRGETSLIYKFGEGVIEGEDLSLSDSTLGVPGLGQVLNIDTENPYEDMT